MIMSLKRGDTVQLVFPGEVETGYQYKVSAVSPDNDLTKDRVDICQVNDTKAFKAKRGIGMPIEYLRKVEV
jgi:hypothetical protein